jgi:putative ABC transport system permease protein
VRTMEGAMAGTVSQPRLQTTLLVIFASVAVALAAIGVYGVMAYTVSQRIPEIGVRMAIGASPAVIIRMVLKEGARLTLLGLAVGLAAAAVAGWGMRGLLYDVKGHDPLTFVLAPLVLALAAAVACYLPARRAARISPLTALTRI